MFETFLIKPLYNGFIYLVGVVPGGDVGLAIIAMTLIIRVIFYPAFAAQIRTTLGMQALQGQLDEIKKKHKDDSAAQARATMALYKENGIRPFASLLALLIQLPILLALYFAFFHEKLPHIAADLLYPFVPVPTTVDVTFFGLLNLLESHNIVLALVVGGLQYAVAYFSMIRVAAAATPVAPERQMAHRMQQTMMLYFLPAVMVVAAYSLPSAAGLYFAASSAISLLQEWVVRKHLGQKH